jgi:uncharacterized membrane protein YfcA
MPYATASARFENSQRQRLSSLWLYPVFPLFLSFVSLAFILHERAKARKRPERKRIARLLTSFEAPC